MGKRLKSSPKVRVGEVGPEGKVVDGWRDGGNERVMEPCRLAVGLVTPGVIGALVEGVCRIRRSPEAPKPCSCSGIISGIEVDL